MACRPGVVGPGRPGGQQRGQHCQFFHTGQTVVAALATRGDVSFSVPGVVIALIAVFHTALCAGVPEPRHEIGAR